MITIVIPDWVVAIIGTIIFWACLVMALNHYDIHGRKIKTKCKKLYYNLRYPYSATGRVKQGSPWSYISKYFNERSEYACSIVEWPERNFIAYVDNDNMAFNLNLRDNILTSDTTIQFRFRKKEDLVMFMVRWA